VKIRLLLSYKGTDFFGWQKQKNQRTVQGEIEKSLNKLFNKSISVVGSGRTDAGVHALGQEAHFEINEKDLQKIDLFQALNHLLANDISVLDVWEAPKDFHARFSAQKKTYQYFIFHSASPPALFQDYVWWIKWPIHFVQLKSLAKVFKGTKDFKSFQSAGSDVKETLKTIYTSRWMQLSSNLYAYEITGSGFLKQMVRNIVGTQIDILKKPDSKAKLYDILASKDRRQALSAAPPQGLYLKEVFYPSALDRKCIQF